jgi:hypothetical protein
VRSGLALRDALVEAGATPEKANKAAEELATFEARFADIKSDLRYLKTRIDTLGGLNITLSLLILGKLLLTHF